MDPFGAAMCETAPGLSTPSPELVEKPVDAMPVSPPLDYSGAVPVAAPVAVAMQGAAGGPGQEGLRRSSTQEEVLNAAEATEAEVEIPT
eukprot:CAMPEP_0181314840 /NCGR_PEP_ID=MMETSP1101-20121128/15040_1 /TAXON_ID=46948 /ORGANISM="Rhodomonas abbreviata, Strain Caron Lab Isolate" /LENGTH=88 /DNA_ID=CAMNT_0023421975 /DNA_START=10 /DNA_END=272 /DNA_ORIENTATION=-